MGLKNFYEGKKVFVTGHTGFKGTWLCLMLLNLGSNVKGFALPPEDTRGNLYKQINLAKQIQSDEADLRDLNALKKSIEDFQPDIIFHLAAQPIVIDSYNDPIGNYETNVMGTIHLLEAARNCASVKDIIIITTDKCYENLENNKSFKEGDPLGGHDPYSSSKAMAEIATKAYYKSFLKDQNIGVATARAGNVIGGGDFANHRIIPDIIEALIKQEPVKLRHPHSTRPWQHVLDALYGYLLIGMSLEQDRDKFSTAYNFSPSPDEREFTVEDIVKIFIRKNKSGTYEIDEFTRKGHEAHYLKLDSSRAQEYLSWSPQFSVPEAINFTADWYKHYINGGDITQITNEQLSYYFSHIDL